MQNGMYDCGIHRAHTGEESRVDAGSLVHANPIGAQGPAQEIGDDPIGDDPIGDEGDFHANLFGEYDKTAMSEFLDESYFLPSNPTSIPITKKRKEPPSVQTPVCQLHEIHALVDERLTSLVYVRRLTSATATKTPRIISSTNPSLGHPILHQCKRPAH